MTCVLVGLRSIRRLACLSQTQLAAKVGITKEAVYRYESSQNLPRPRHLENLCRVLNCQPWQLYHPDPIRAAQMMELGYRVGGNMPLPETAQGVPVESEIKSAFDAAAATWDEDDGEPAEGT